MKTKLLLTAVSGFTETSAASGGTVTSDGGAAVSVCRVCWSTGDTPTIVYKVIIVSVDTNTTKSFKSNSPAQPVETVESRNEH